MKESVKKFFRFFNLLKRYQQEQVHKRVMYVFAKMHSCIYVSGLCSQFGGKEKVTRDFQTLARAMAEEHGAPQKTFDEMARHHYFLLYSYSGANKIYGKFVAAELSELAPHLEEELQKDIVNLFIRLGFAELVSKMLDKMGEWKLVYNESITLAGTILCNKDSTEAVFLIQKIRDMSHDCLAITNVCSILRYVEKPSPEIAASDTEGMHL